MEPSAFGRRSPECFFAEASDIEPGLLPTYLLSGQYSAGLSGKGSHTMRTLAIQRLGFAATAVAILFVGAIVVGLI
jgi:hypothetical protein